MNSCSGNGTFPSSSWDSWNLLPERSTSQWPGRCRRPLSISWEISHGGEIMRSWKGLNPFFLAKVEKKLHEHHLKSCILLLVVGPSTHQFCENARFRPTPNPSRSTLAAWTRGTSQTGKSWTCNQSHSPLQEWEVGQFPNIPSNRHEQQAQTHTHTNFYDLWIFTVYFQTYGQIDPLQTLAQIGLRCR